MGKFDGAVFKLTKLCLKQVKNACVCSKFTTLEICLFCLLKASTHFRLKQKISVKFYKIGKKKSA